MLFGAAYYPEHRERDKWAFDVEMMAGAGVNCLRIGEFAWKLFEPSEGIYDFSWLDEFLEIAGNRGIKVLLCPPMRTAPDWLVRKDPEVLITLDSGLRLSLGSRYTFCINNPYLRERAGLLAEALANHFGNHEGITGWHLDNEFGDEPDCHCPNCQHQFIEYCRSRYGEISALNRAWGLDFWGLRLDSFNDIISPKLTKTFHSPGHLQAWRQFRSDSTNRAIGMLSGKVRQNKGKEQFVTTNHQPLWNSKTDYFDTAEHLDVCGTNYYPPYGGAQALNVSMGLSAARAYGKRKFQVHELRNGPHMIPGRANNSPAHGEIEKTTVHAVANGATGIFYFRWKSCPFGAEQSHGTIVDYEGRPRRIYGEVAGTGSKLNALSVLIDESNINSSIALLYDFPTRWIMETGSNWNGDEKLYLTKTKKLYSVLQRFGINLDLTGRNQSWDNYSVLIIPFLSAMTDSLARKVRDFAYAGGTVILHPLCGTKDEDGVIYPQRIHPLLKEVLDFDLTDFITLGEGEEGTFMWNEKSYGFSLFGDLIRDMGPATVVSGTMSSGWYENYPAICETGAGEGRLVYFAAFPDETFYEDYFSLLFSEKGLLENRIVEEAGHVLLPAGVELITHTLKENDDIYYLINHNAFSVSLKSREEVRDVYHDSVMEAGNFTLEPFGIRVLKANRS